MPSGRPSAALTQSRLFQQHVETLPLDVRVRVSYDRARAICLAFNLSPADVLTLSPKFWQLHTDPILSMDGAVAALVTIQLNLCAGTLAMFAAGRPDLDDVLRQVLRFDISGQYCLTEIGHGLDAINMETTATLLESGEFDLHTPTEAAAKFMPPTTPINKPCVSVVFARLVVKNEDRGIRPFLVRIHDGKNMQPGVTSTALPPRGGSAPLNHALTSFNHVRLPASALLGSLERPADARASFFYNISRVIVGAIALGSMSIPIMQLGATIVARYSMRRHVVDHHTGALRPLLSFQTQKLPVLATVAHAYVMQAFHRWTVSVFTTAKNPHVRHAVSVIFKVTIISLVHELLPALGDRCGAQGLFEVNQLLAMHGTMRGAAIAEGDLLVTSIRTASELLLGRYAVPETTDASSLLARHEAASFTELRDLVGRMAGHRSADYDRLVLPECLPLVRVIGHRMAYDAARDAGVDPALLSLFEASSLRLNSAAFVELGVSRARQRAMEVEAVDAVFPKLEALLEDMAVDAYVSAPIVSSVRWEEYMSSLQTWSHDSDGVLAVRSHL